MESKSSKDKLRDFRMEKWRKKEGDSDAKRELRSTSDSCLAGWTGPQRSRGSRLASMMALR